jgi:hypothetical protein
VIDERQADLDARQSDLDACQADLDDREGELDARRASLDAREAEIDQQREVSEAARSATDREPDELPGEPDQEKLHFEEPSQASPQSSEEVFRRMGMASLLNEDEEGQQWEETPSPPAPEKTRPVTETPDPTSPPEEDESIDDYMARLLDRVRAGTGRSHEPPAFGASSLAASASPASAQPASARPASANATSSLAASAEPASAPPAPEAADSPSPGPASASEPREPAPWSPRAVAPERSLDLSAMRDLANYSAQAAIDHHARRRLLGTAITKLVVTAASLAAAAILLWIWWAHQDQRATLYAAFASLVVALLWAAQYVFLRASIFLTKSRRAERNRNGDQEEAAE